MLAKLSEKNIAGVITTNYDDFVEIILMDIQNMWDRDN